MAGLERFRQSGVDLTVEEAPMALEDQREEQSPKKKKRKLCLWPSRPTKEERVTERTLEEEERSFLDLHGLREREEKLQLRL